MLTLRELRPADLAAINRWRNDREVIDLLGNNFRYIAEAIDEAWYERYLHHRDTSVRLALVIPDTGRLIGLSNLTEIHPINRSAEFSIMIGEKDCWGRGFGTFATAAMLRHGFVDLNLHRIYLYVLTHNQRARATYEKLGFRTEGQLNQAIFKNGEYQDLLLMALLREDYQG